MECKVDIHVLYMYMRVTESLFSLNYGDYFSGCGLNF